MGFPNMMMGNQNYLNNQNNNVGFNKANEKKDNDIHDKEEILPRNIDLAEEKPINPEENMINIIFSLSTGPKVIIYINKYSSFKEAVKKFCQKINLDEKYIDNRLRFIYTSRQISIDSNTNLTELKLMNNSSINVYDDDNVVGT